jgi:VCBS repeat-containing protein
MNKRLKHNLHNSKFIFEELEERRLFSGGIEGLIDTSPDFTTQAIYQDVDGNQTQTGDADAPALQLVAQQQSREIVFIDAAVENHQQLVDDLNNNQDTSRDIEVVVLERDKDGIEQISNLLQDRDNLDAIHIISHGIDGSVNLGNASLDAATLEQDNSKIALWANAFTESGDILIYGCNLTQSEAGASLVNTLGALTLTDVAASDDLTGHASLGGDWELEYHQGIVETDIAVSSAAQQQWMGLLSPVTLTSQESVDSDYEIKSDQNAGQTFSYTSGDGTYTVENLEVQMRVNGGAQAQNLTVSLRSSWNGPDLASASIAASSLGTSYSWENFDLGGVVLNDGATYYIRVTSDDSSGKVFVGYDSSASYANGDFLDKDGNAQSGADLAFRVTYNNSDPVTANIEPGALAFTEDTGSTQITSTITLADADHPDMQSATIQITAGYLNGADVLAFADTTNITGSWDSGSGTLTLIGTDTQAAYQAALRAVTYDTSNGPGTATRTIAFVVNDGYDPSNSVTRDITLTPVNDAPLLTTTSPLMVPIEASDTGNAGQTVSTLLTSSDPDIAALEGIAITATSNTGPGAWEYSIDGGSNWTPVGVVTVNSALLLRDTDLVRFEPDGATPETGSFDFRAWDRSDGGSEGSKIDASATGGVEAFSIASDSASIAVVMNLSTINLTAYEISDSDYEIKSNQNGGQTFSYTSGNGSYTVQELELELRQNSGGPAQTITVSLREGWNGPDLASATIAKSALGTSLAWHNFALGNITLNDGMTYYIRVSSDSAAGNVFAGYDSTSSYADGDFIDKDGNAQGGQDMAFRVIYNNVPPTTANIEAGTLDYIENGTTAVTSTITVADADHANLQSATIQITAGYLSGEDVLAFADTANITGSWGSVSGTLTLTGTDTRAAWELALRAVTYSNSSDDPNLTNRTVAFTVSDGLDSSNTVSRDITITRVNDAPNLTPAAPNLTTIDEDAIGNSGDLVSAIVGVSISDPDTGAVQGIAITGLSSGNGSWQYDIGAGWANVDVVSNANALLLRSTDSLRFVPDQQNANSATLTYRAWDRTDGGTEGSKVDISTNGATTAFSTALDTASITVTALNDAPVLADTFVPMDVVNEHARAPIGAVGILVGSLTGGLSDVDTGSVAGIAVVGADNSDGTWHYSTNDGATWNTLGTPATATARLLAVDGQTRLYFEPTGGYTGLIDPAITFHAWDRTSGANGGTADLSLGTGATTAFSIATDTASQVVTRATVLHSYDVPLSNVDPNEFKSPQNWGQTFSFDFGAGTYDLDAIGIVLYRASDAPVQTLTISIRSSWGGAMIASGSILSTDLGTTEAWESVSFDSTATLNDNTTYYIRVDTNGAEKVFVGVDGSGSYTDGDLINKDGLPETGKDMVFRLYTANGVPEIMARETVDSDGDGQADQVRITTNQYLNDNFGDLNVAVSGYTVTGYSTDIANDNIFYVDLTESGTPDSDAIPNITVTANTLLTDFGGSDALAPEAPAGWWDANWLNRQQITLDNSASSGNLNQFPVLIEFDFNDIDFSKIKAGGADIRFRDSDGSELYYEIQDWDDTPGAESAKIWVNVAQLNNSGTDSIYLYYNNEAATDAQDPNRTWNAAYTGVYHLGESGTGAADDYKDSSGAGNHAQGGGGSGSATPTLTTSGKIDDGQDFDGSNDFINFASTDFGNTFTFEAWIKPDPTSSSHQNIVANSSTGADDDGFRFFFRRDTGKILFETGNGSSGNGASTATGVIDFNQWNHIAVSVDRTTGTATIFHNGVDVTTDNTVRTDFNTNGVWRLGQFLDGGFKFKGEIDEFRVSDVARSADWIETSRLNQLSNTLATFGGDEEIGVAATDDADPVAFITRDDADPTGASTVTFSVDFSEDVSNVDPTDFVVVPTGTASANPIVTVGNASDSDDSTYTVTVSGITGAGTIGLDFVGGNNIDDDVGNLLNITPVTDQVYTHTNNLPTFGGDDTGVVTEDVAVVGNMIIATGTLTITDTDPGEDSFQAGTINGLYGDLIIDAAGDWSYSADNTQAAIQSLDVTDTLTDTLTVTAFDGTTHDVVITINGAEDAPVAVDDAVTATEDTVLNSVIDLDANDTDIDGDALSVVAGAFATTQGGSITIAADGSYTYTPATNFNGVDSVDYTVTDGALTDVGTLTINVTAVNDAPVAVDDAVTATEDTVLNSVIRCE